MITPVVLCGGTGSRLWPLSRESYPKQFSKINSELTLFQEALERVKGDHFENPIIVTNYEHRFVISEQLKELGITPSAILLEPTGKDTAPAILLAVQYLVKQNLSKDILIIPSDHSVENVEEFQRQVTSCVPFIEKFDIITFGIKPDRPETGYGYIETTGNFIEKPTQAKNFVEKPKLSIAEQMVKSGKFLWNSGMFLCTANTILNAFSIHQKLMEQVDNVIKASIIDLSFVTLNTEIWSQISPISFDYLILENLRNIGVLQLTNKWSDLGSWKSVWAHADQDDLGNSQNGNVTVLECSNTIIWSDAKDVELVGIGLQDIVVAVTGDAVLVSDINATQKVKHVVQALKEKKAKQAHSFSKEYRPWGWYETLALDARFQVKRIHVNPGGTLSLQSHMHRSEHWVVVSGTAEVVIDDCKKLVTENESIYVPLGTKHRLSNPGKLPMVLIEVQTGSYLGEDDIVRYSDIYNRV